MLSVSRIALGLTAAAIAGCAGAGLAPSRTGPAEFAAVSLTVRLPAPAAAAHARLPRYVSTATRSIGVIVASHAGTSAPATIACSSGVCSGSVMAPLGTEALTVSLHDAPNAGGNVLATGTAWTTVRAGASNSLSLTFNPVVASVALNFTAPTLPAGSPANTTLAVVTTDPAGAMIVGPGTYVDAFGNPLTITVSHADSGGSGSTAATAAAFTDASSNTTVVAYNGGSMYNAAYSVSVDRPISGTTTGASLAIAGAAVTEYTTGINAAAIPVGLCTGPDGNLWFTEHAAGASKIGRITPSGTVTEFSAGITAGSQPTLITAGPDKNLWFTEKSADKIGRITTTGTVTEFSAGITGGAAPDDIRAGPDGNLWFTEYSGNRIGRITTTGTVTEFSAGITAGAQPQMLALGPDGNFWFTEYFGNRIGRITTNGTVTEFSGGITPLARPDGIIAGPDGNMWFTEYNADKIGVMTTAGTLLTEYSQGISTNSNVQYIVVGPDGNLWFTEYSGPRIGRITTNGTITEFGAGISPTATPWGMAIGPDGNIWFGENNRPAVARLVY